MSEWTTSFCRYAIDPEVQGQVKVTLMDYKVTKEDQGFTALTSGVVDLEEDDRVFPLPALENVPENVMTGWVQDALGAEEVQRIEDGLDAEIAIQIELNKATNGGFIPT